MIDATLLAALTGIIGAIGAMVWSFLMASKIAAPRAAEKSKLLLVSILTGATPEDKEILERVQNSLVRPVVTEAFNQLGEQLPDSIAEHVDMHFKAFQSAEAKNMGKLIEELNLEGISKEMQEEAIQRLSLGQRATMKVMTLKIPKATREAHPLSSALFDSSRAEIAQGIAAILGQYEDQRGGVSVENARGGAHNPGAIR